MLIREYNILPEERTPLTVVKHALKTLFWATVYLAFSYLTIISTFEVIRQYRDDEVKTNMKAVINNNVTYLPNMTICLKINVLELFSIQSTSSLNYMSAWSRFFNETVSPEGIFKVNKSQVYDDEIYLSLLKYLAMIYEAERAWEPGLTQISTLHSEESDDWIALKKVLVPNIEHFNITLEQLKSVFDGKFCPVPRDWDPDWDPSNHLLSLEIQERECLARNKISFIGMDTICFRLIGYKNYLRELGSTDYINLHLYNDGTINQKWCQEFTVDLGSESRSTPRRTKTQNEPDGDYYNRFIGAASVNMDIGVKALYRELPYVNGNIQCSSGTSQEECEHKCLREWIRANCHCSPITFNLTTDISSYRNCTVDGYSLCLKRYTENATYLCTNKCVPLCEQWHYDYHFKAVDAVGFEEFVGALGGALGIWLGLDFVIIIELIVKLLKKFIKKISMRNVHNSEDGMHRKSANIKHRGRNVEDGISSSHETGSRVVGHQAKCNESECNIGRASIRQTNEKKKRKISRKKRESHAFQEKHVQLRRKGSNNNSVNIALADDKKKNTDAHEERLQNCIVKKNDTADTVQHGSSAHGNYFRAHNKFVQKMLVLFLNGDASTNKRVMFLQLAEKLFWAAIYLVGSVFTTKGCFELINLYLADEPVYFPSLVSNRAVSLPPPSLCIFYQPRPFFQKQDNISNALMNYFSQSDITSASFIQISNETDWPKPLVSIGLLYFSVLSNSEIIYADSNFITVYEWQLDDAAGEDTLLRNDIENSINNILLPKVLEWNVTANELRQKLGAELARMIELKISFTNTSGTIDIVNETSFYASAITSGSICYSLPYSVNFTDPDDALKFSINKSSYPQLFSRTGGHIIFSDYLLEPRNAPFGIIQHNAALYDLDYFPLGYGRVLKVLIGVFGLYTSRPEAKGVKYCSPNTTKSYCYAQCRIKLIEKSCNCSPTYWTAMTRPTSGLNECTFDRYMGCLNFSTSDELDCRDSCLPFCSARYSQSDSTSYSPPQGYGDTAGVSCVIKLGGTLGIFLGFSIFSFFQAFITTVTLCFAFILKRIKFANSPKLLKCLAKIKKSGMAQLISYLYRQLLAMNICTIKENIKINEIGKTILLKIGYLIGLYATVRMSNDLFYSLKSGESKCRVDLLMNTTIKLPSSTICMPLEAVEFLCKKEIRRFENNIDLKRNLHFNFFNSKEEFFNKHWPNWRIRWAYEYLIIYDAVERHGNQKFISALLPDNDCYTSNESRNTLSKYSFTSLMELDELIDYLKITIPELKHALGQKVRDIYKVQAVLVKQSDGALNETVLNVSDTTFIGEEKICYKLPLEKVTFSSTSDYIFISLNRGSLPNPEYLSDGKPITIDFSGRDVSKEQSKEAGMNGSTYSFQFDKHSFAKLEISWLYEAKPVSSGVRQCSQSKSMDTCQDECQQKKIERVCKCSPATWSRFPSSTNLTRCHLIDYKRCAKFLVSNDADVCELSCVPHCTRISFKIKLNLDEQSLESKAANFNLTTTSFEYLSIKEVDKYTTNDLLNEFGGILSLWIGLDILVFVDLFYWLVCKGCLTFRQFL